jgi:hypothetical protein
MKGTKWVALIGAGLLSGAMAFAQTSSTQQNYPQTTTTQSTSPQAGASATASPNGVSGSVSGTALPQSTTSTTESGAQTTSQPAAPGQTAPQGTSQPAAAPGQGSNPQSSAPQGTTTYTTTTQTTVPQSAQSANGAAQTSTTPGTTPGMTAGSSAAAVPGAVPSTGQPEVLIDPAKIYNDKQPISWVGKPVVLQNVMIQDTNDTGNFWVGSDGHHRLLIVKQDSNPNLKAMRFHKGDIVTVTGTVQPASKYMAQATTESDGSMHDAEKSSGVFLLADNVTVASSTHK